jgi:hypothetical protein
MYIDTANDFPRTISPCLVSGKEKTQNSEEKFYYDLSASETDSSSFTDMSASEYDWTEWCVLLHMTFIYIIYDTMYAIAVFSDEDEEDQDRHFFRELGASSIIQPTASVDALSPDQALFLNFLRLMFLNRENIT